MTIPEYCKSERITYEQLAQATGYKTGTIKNAASGQMKPGMKMILRIEKATDRKVTRKDLRPDYFP
jgi:transcriptional regulator with XRE-family HTH domain